MKFINLMLIALLVVTAIPASAETCPSGLPRVTHVKPDIVLCDRKKSADCVVALQKKADEVYPQGYVLSIFDKFPDGYLLNLLANDCNVTPPAAKQVFTVLSCVRKANGADGCANKILQAYPDGRILPSFRQKLRVFDKLDDGYIVLDYKRS